MSAMLSRARRRELAEWQKRARALLRSVDEIEIEIMNVLGIGWSDADLELRDKVTDFVSGVCTVNDLVVYVRTKQARREEMEEKSS